ncbi:MAG: type III-A CRISPR-associated RAMP protein Csm3 [Prevotella sp.]|uniref:type III-A CRISPR-associated RAMP protein Csm3 n=1 Tax=Prevotella sp. TaxID=59823 RepID=UPI002A33EC4B|nr:type III-A CRISPR-associated RAMP protein Csm3 [Prevotella sp.]MDD7318489.1 type III-A CRISPR-associated RAMP protein Csm3 [Prevotellaceae bacterium]MDY4020160.1 type III-A CRISPR-associated RAMP protein Csm3 [Prevotella sp.]
MKQLTKKIRIRTTITLITGLHIGGSKDNVEIGGIDIPVIKLASKGNQPYIPGSSLKGKMRCLLEQVAGSPEIGLNSEVNNLFGITENGNKNDSGTLPSKLIVRDAMLTEESVKQLIECESLDMPYTENKFENTIDRVQGVANNLRQIERVPAGAVFNAEFIINIWDDDNEQEMLDLFNKGMSLIENDYIGGSGSRGYGQIKFGEMYWDELSEANNWKA